MDSSGLKSSDLVSSATLSSSNDSTSVAHTSSWGSCLSGNEADDGQLTVVMGTKPLSGFFFGLTSDFTDHDNTFGLGIVNELCKNIDEVSSVERITTDSDNCALSETL